MSFAALFFSFFLGASAFAQVDPSSSALLRSRGQAPEKEELDSSRYSVRSKQKLRIQHQEDSGYQSKVEPPSGFKNTAKPKPTAKANASVENATEKVSSAPAESNTKAETATAKTESATVVNAPAAETADAKAPQGVAEKVQYVLLGGTQEEVEDYRKTLHPLDTRLNLFEIAIAPAYIYNDSGSKYWFRNYQTQSPGIVVSGSLWFSPFFGIQSTYITSTNTDLSGSPDGSTQLAVDHEWFEAGFRIRKFFSSSRKSSQLIFGLDYNDYELKVPSNAAERVGLRSGGVKLSMEALLPSTNAYSWTLGVEFSPRQQHKEKATTINLHSGSSVHSDRAGASFGGRYTFDRYNQVFWKFSQTVEKNVFYGGANTADPTTGVTPLGVGVTNSFTIFQLGYIWGN